MKADPANTNPLTQELRNRAIGEYHDLLATDESLSARLFEQLRETMRADQLVYGGRPIGIALRPHLLDEQQFHLLSTRAQAIASALEKVVAAALDNSSLMQHLGMSEAETELARVDPGVSLAGVTTRLDGFIHGHEIKFVEYNAENPSSLSDQAGLNRLLFAIPAMRTIAGRYRLRQFLPVERLLESLLASYREWGGSGAPKIAILDWENLPTSNEFVLLRDHFASHGVQTTICSPDDLEYRGGALCAGDFRIDLIYKRVLIHEFLARCASDHPVIRAYRDRKVCLVNPFRCKIVHKKTSFEILTDEERAGWFTSAEREAIARSVPWTRRFQERRTSRAGKSIELLEYVRRNRETLVLKPNDDYGGRGVFLGPHLNEHAWEEAIAAALAGDYVVQDLIDLQPEHFPVFTERAWQLQPMFVDTNPFLFHGKVCGAMVRLSGSPIVNVASGGGETGFFVIGE